MLIYMSLQIPLALTSPVSHPLFARTLVGSMHMPLVKTSPAVITYMANCRMTGPMNRKTLTKCLIFCVALLYEINLLLPRKVEIFGVALLCMLLRAANPYSIEDSCEPFHPRLAATPCRGYDDFGCND